MMLAATYNAAPAESRQPTQNLMLAALGVVYGDIGTSPLYAVRQSLVEFGEAGETAQRSEHPGRERPEGDDDGSLRCGHARPVAHGARSVRRVSAAG